MKCIHSDLFFFFLCKEIKLIPKAINHKAKGRITTPHHVHDIACFLFKGKTLRLKGTTGRS